MANFQYVQSAGTMRLVGDPSNGVSVYTLIGRGYSGSPAGKNDPTKQSIACVGPLPQGWYTLGKIETEVYEHKAPPVIHLIPDASNEMFGRAGFLIHGDTDPPGNASEGCIILPHDVRLRIAASGVKRLQVVGYY